MGRVEWVSVADAVDLVRACVRTSGHDARALPVLLGVASALDATAPAYEGCLDIIADAMAMNPAPDYPMIGDLELNAHHGCHVVRLTPPGNGGAVDLSLLNALRAACQGRPSGGGGECLPYTVMHATEFCAPMARADLLDALFPFRRQAARTMAVVVLREPNPNATHFRPLLNVLAADLSAYGTRNHEKPGTEFHSVGPVRRPLSLCPDRRLVEQVLLSRGIQPAILQQNRDPEYLSPHTARFVLEYDPVRTCPVCRVPHRCPGNVPYIVWRRGHPLRLRCFDRMAQADRLSIEL